MSAMPLENKFVRPIPRENDPMLYCIGKVWFSHIEAIRESTSFVDMCAVLRAMDSEEIVEKLGETQAEILLRQARINDQFRVRRLIKLFKIT